MNAHSFLGAGWSFPPTFAAANDQLLMTSGEANIKQSIDLLLQTPKGSRCLLPNHGFDVSRFVFRHVDASLQEEMVQSVKQTLLEFEPRISVESVELAFAEDESTIALNIRFKIKQTNTRHNHVFPFSLIEGTLLDVGHSRLTG